jgi:hypothetical protein
MGVIGAQQRGRTRRVTELLKRSCRMRPVVHTSNPPAKLRTADFKHGRKNGASARSNGVIEKPDALIKLSSNYEESFVNDGHEVGSAMYGVAVASRWAWKEVSD